MSKSAEPTIKEGKLYGIMKRVPGGALMFAVLPLAVISYLAWYYYGAEHLDQALYSLRAENLQATKQPVWIRVDVAKEVFDDNRLNNVSLLDPQSNAYIARAFETHPWVKSTTRVSKEYGGLVRVDLVYRQPIAMVYLRYQYEKDGQKLTEEGFYPVDKDAIILPTKDNFTREDVKDYLVIDAKGASSGEEAGKEFGDPAVKVAAKLCALLSTSREKYGLRTVVVQRDYAAAGTSPWRLTVLTRDGRKIIWGRPPAQEMHGEPSARDKIERMASWLDESPTDSKLLDLTSLTSGATNVSSRMAPSGL